MENNNVRRRILRAARSLYNACQKTYTEDRCKGCPFNVTMGCNLYGHPIEWGSMLKSFKD